MKVTPVSTVSNISRSNSYTNKRCNYTSLCFTGKKELVKPSFFAALKNRLEKLVLPAAGAVTVPQLLSRQETEENSEHIDLYLRLNTNSVPPRMFNELYSESPELARALVYSGRSVSLYDFNKYTDLASLKLNDKQCNALETMLAARFVTKSPVFEIGEITSNCIDSLDDKTCDAIINNKDTLFEIFSNIPQTLNGAQDYINTAVVLDTKKNIDAEEFITYFETMTEYNFSALMDWADGDKNVRKQILDKINSSAVLAKYLEKYYLPIVPDEELVKKFDFIIEQEKNNKSIDYFLKSPQDVFDRAYTLEGLERGINRLKTLPSDALECVRQTTLGDIIAHFETLKSIGSVKSSLTLDDYLWFAENWVSINENSRKNINDSEVFFSIQQTLTDENKKTFKENIPLLNKISAEYSGLNANNTINLLFNKYASENLKKLEKIFDEDADYIIKETEYKCKNTNPVFVDIVKKFFSNKDNMPPLLLTPDINKETIIDNFFQISKIRPAIAKEPEKYVNNVKENYSDLELCFLQKYLELGNTNPAMAENFLLALDESIIGKFYVIAASIDYNNAYYLNRLYNTVAVTDAEYVNMLLAKRLHKFVQNIDDIQNLSYKSKYYINKLIRHGKNRNNAGDIIKLSGKQKHLIVDYIPIMQQTFEDNLAQLIEKYSEPVGRKNDFVFDLKGFLNEYSRQIFAKLGYSEEQQMEFADSLAGWDRNLIHYLLTPNSRDKGELKLVFDLVTHGNFNDYINNPLTSHGRSNLQTENIFKHLGIDYDRWLSGIASENLSIAGNEYTIGLIDRSERNMVFMGNYTSCCTALNEEKGDSVPNYLLNTAFNVMGVRDKQGNIAATSRIFVSNSGDAPVVIIDNIEVSNKFRATVNKRQSEQFAEEVWNYIYKFAQSLSNRHIPVYMSNKHPKISLPERSVISSRIKLAGETTKPELYINTIGEYVNTKSAYGCDLINIFNEP